jgi:dipeptidyl-peptidase 4
VGREMTVVPFRAMRKSPVACAAGLAAILVALAALPAIASPETSSAPSPAASEPGQLTAADYRRAERLLGANAVELVYGAEVDPQWIDESDLFWYRNRFREGFEFVLVDAATGERRRAFDHQRLAAALSEASGEAYEPFNLPFEEIRFVDENQAVEVEIDEERWTCHLETYRCEGPREPRLSVEDSVVSPDGRWAAYIEAHDLWVRDLESGEEQRLTSDGEERHGYATDSQGWRRTDTPVLVWSPDSRRIATYRLDEREVAEMHLLEMASPRPILHSWPYALPGDTAVPMHQRIVVDRQGPTVVTLEAEPDHQRTSSCCGLTREDLWADVEWRDDGGALAFVSTSRDYRSVSLFVADPESGAVRQVLEESHPQFFLSNIRSGGVPNWRVLHQRGEVLWFSERSGWGHLYLYDLATGELKNRVTGGAWNVLDVHRVDEEGGRVFFTAVGREPGRDPYFRHLYSVGLDGSGLTLLTPEDADHEVTFAPSGESFVDAFSTPWTAPTTVVRRAADGTLLGTVEQADISELLTIGWRAAEPFTVKARDGVTVLYGLLYKPSDFDPERSYPVINSIYPGPQVGSIRTRSFEIDRRGAEHALAELGFVVVQVDALGTPLRSKAFHAATYGDLGDNGLEDQKRAMEQLAARHPWIDLDRVGMVGHSGGGYATTRALLTYPDFFHVGVASAGNHDNRGYTDYWGERWHGPREVDEEGADNYEGQANHPLAGELRGRLLLSYGTMDSNVHPNLTLLLIDELIEHGHDFDLMVFPNRRHGYSREPYNVKRTWDYFVTHLLGQQPPAG